MKLDHKHIFVDGNNYNLDVLIEMVKNLKPYKITHLKIEGKIFYKTIFQSESKLILVDGPLTSGYGGQGPSEFAKLLSNLGFDDDILEKYIFTALRERESPRFQSWDESDMLKNLNYFRIYIVSTYESMVC